MLGYSDAGRRSSTIARSSACARFQASSRRRSRSACRSRSTTTATISFSPTGTAPTTKGSWSTWRACRPDVAYILEALPLEERLVVWDLVKADRDGEILLEVSDAVRETLIASMDEDELVAATGAARHRRDRRPRARPAARSHPGRLQVALGRGARAVARGDVVRRGLGRRAHGFRHGRGARGREPRKSCCAICAGSTRCRTTPTSSSSSTATPAERAAAGQPSSREPARSARGRT